MTALEYLNRHPGAPIERLLSAGSWSGTGYLDALPRYELDALVREGSAVFVPTLAEVALHLARYVVERALYEQREQMAWSPYPYMPCTYEKLQRLDAQHKESVRFWLTVGPSQPGPPAPGDRPSRALAAPKQQGALVQYALPVPLPPKHPCSNPAPKPMKGQPALVAALFRALPPGTRITAQEATDRLTREGFTCNQDPLRAIYYVLNEWKKRGWLA